MGLKGMERDGTEGGRSRLMDGEGEQHDISHTFHTLHTCRYGGKLVMAGGILWFSAASLLLPLAVSEPLMAAGLTVPAVLFARCMVVSEMNTQLLVVSDMQC